MITPLNFCEYVHDLCEKKKGTRLTGAECDSLWVKLLEVDMVSAYALLPIKPVVKDSEKFGPLEI